MLWILFVVMNSLLWGNRGVAAATLPVMAAKVRCKKPRKPTRGVGLRQQTHFGLSRRIIYIYRPKNPGAKIAITHPQGKSTLLFRPPANRQTLKHP